MVSKFVTSTAKLRLDNEESVNCSNAVSVEPRLQVSQRAYTSQSGAIKDKGYADIGATITYDITVINYSSVEFENIMIECSLDIEPFYNGFFTVLSSTFVYSVIGNKIVFEINKIDKESLLCCSFRIRLNDAVSNRAEIISNINIFRNDNIYISPDSIKPLTITTRDIALNMYAQLVAPQQVLFDEIYVYNFEFINTSIDDIIIDKILDKLPIGFTCTDIKLKKGKEERKYGIEYSSKLLPNNNHLIVTLDKEISLMHSDEMLELEVHGYNNLIKEINENELVTVSNKATIEYTSVDKEIKKKKDTSVALTMIQNNPLSLRGWYTKNKVTNKHRISWAYTHHFSIINSFKEYAYKLAIDVELLSSFVDTNYVFNIDGEIIELVEYEKNHFYMEILPAGSILHLSIECQYDGVLMPQGILLANMTVGYYVAGLNNNELYPYEVKEHIYQ